MSNKLFRSGNGRTQADFEGTVFVIQAGEQLCEGSSFIRKKISLQMLFLQHFLLFAPEKLVLTASTSTCFKSGWCSLGLVFQSLTLLPLQPMLALPGRRALHGHTLKCGCNALHWTLWQTSSKSKQKVESVCSAPLILFGCSSFGAGYCRMMESVHLEVLRSLLGFPVQAVVV